MPARRHSVGANLLLPSGGLPMAPHRMIHSRRGRLTEPVWDADSGTFGERPYPPPDPRQAERAAMAAEALWGPMAEGGPLSDRLALLEACNPEALDLPAPDRAGWLSQLRDRALTQWARWLALPAGPGRESERGSAASGNSPHR